MDVIALRVLRLFILLGTALCLASVAHAATLEVKPTMAMITPDQRVATIKLVNPEETAASYQIRLYRWTQKDDVQSLDETDEVIVSPPMISLAPKASQVVRIGLRGGDFPNEEVTYRMILDEIPTAEGDKPSGLNLSLRISLPLFVRSAPLPPAQLDAEMMVDGKDTKIKVFNRGKYTARIAHVRLAAKNGDPAAVGDLPCLIYILPGGWNVFTVTPEKWPDKNMGGIVALQTDDGEISLDAPVSVREVSDAGPPALH